MFQILPVLYSAPDHLKHPVEKKTVFSKKAQFSIYKFCEN